MSETAAPVLLRGGPFDPEDDAAYVRWRDAKLAGYPRSLVVEVGDPRVLTAAERTQLAECCRRANMVVYASSVRGGDHDIPRGLGAQFGLASLDRNWLADDDGISEVRVAPGGARGDYIPYTDRPIRWHTDGYYNPPGRRIRAMVLHCVAAAAQGGENGFMDHEMAFLALREENSAHVRALMRADAMTIPERTDEDGVARPAQAGPVFSVDPDNGTLHMRYTARTRSIAWSADADVRAAATALERLLAAPSPWIHRVTLAPGMGILCNNVLHERTGFVDDPAHPRVILRARYHERIDAAGAT